MDSCNSELEGDIDLVYNGIELGHMVTEILLMVKSDGENMSTELD